MAAPKGNKFALGLTDTGRPPIYDDPKVLREKCEEYFISCLGEGFDPLDEDYIPPEPITITGLALYLGFSSRGTIYEYEKKDEFSDIIKRAMLVVENNYESKAQGKNPAGPIFILKNMGWYDKTTIVNTEEEKPPGLEFD